MNQPDTSRTLLFDRSSSKSLRIVLFSTLFFLLGLWFTLSPETFSDNSMARRIGSIGIAPELFTRVLGIVSMLFGAFGIYSWLRHSRNEGEVLRLSPTGLSINAGAIRLEELPWNQVTGTRIINVLGNRMLGILVTDPQSVIAQQSMSGRFFGRLNARSWETPLYVSVTMVTADLNHLAESIETYASEYGGKAG